LGTPDLSLAAVVKSRWLRNPRVLNPRKLAAIDLVFPGPKTIISEFTFAVLFSPALGVFVLIRGHRTATQIVLGCYLICVGLNYLPMLVYAVAINATKSARTELGNELDDTRAAMRKYRRQSIWLLMPLVVAIVALTQARKSLTTGDR
jgi:hypothetical protein